MNKKKLRFFALVCILSGGWNSLCGQDNLVVSTSQGKDNFSLSKILKIDFREEGLQIIAQDDLSGKWFNYLDINKLTFSLEGVGIERIGSASELFLYPNPAVEWVQIAGWDSSRKETICIYSTTGQLCYMRKEWDGAPIRVSALSQGSYILKINSHTFKFRKL